MVRNGDNTISGDVTVPETVTYNGTVLTVNAIGDYAFYSYNKLSSVSLPSSIRTIEKYAFMSCSSLHAIVIPEGVITLDDNALSSCDSLASVIIPQSMTDIGENAFSECKFLNFVRLPAGIKTIGANTFYNSCAGAIYVESTTPPALAEYNEQKQTSGWGQDQTTKVYVPAGSSAAYRSAAGWKDYAQILEYDPADASIQPQTFTIDGVSYFISGISTDNTCTVVCSADAVYSGDITVPATVTNGGKTYDVSAVGSYTFYGYNSLTSVTLSEGITAIGAGAFYWSSISSVSLPSTLTHIGEECFMICSALAAIDIPDNITDISSMSFIGCGFLTSVTLPGKLTHINQGAFTECINLPGIILPEHVKRIGSEAFLACRALTTICFPASVDSIDSFAFDGCYALESVYTCATTPPVMDDEAFSDYTIPLYVPTGTADAYRKAEGWKQFSNISEFDATGMDEALTGNADGNAEKKDAKFYDLNGIIVPTPMKNGVYINNGRKIVY